MITSKHNSKIQLVRALLGKTRERQEQNAFVIEGVRLVEEALHSGWIFRFALFSSGLTGRGEKLVRGLEAAGMNVEEVAQDLMQSVSETETSQGVLAVIEHKVLPIPRPLDFVLILDGVRDPGNLGSLLRTAAAAGVQAVFLPPEAADAFAPKVVRAGMGAHFHLPILELDWDEIHTHVYSLRVYLTEMEAATTCWQSDFRQPLALIIGGEAEGPSRKARELANQQVAIPMPGNSESLNAAVAGAILMFEAVRQRTMI